MGISIVYILFTLLLISKLLAQTKFEKDIDNLASHFRDYAKDSIGVDALQDRFYELTSTEAVIVNAEVKLDKIVKNIQERTDIARNILSDLKTYIEKDDRDNPNGDNSREIIDCCLYQTLQWNNLFQSYVNMNEFCEMFPHHNQSYCPGKQINKLTPRLFHKKNALKKFKQAYQDGEKMSLFVYYGAEDGYFIQYPATNNESPSGSICNCAQYDPRSRPWYVGTASPEAGKDLVLAIDVTESFKDAQMKKMLTDLVGIILSSLGDRDRILVTFYGGGQRYGDLECMKKLTSVTPALTNALRDVVKSHAYTGASISYSDVFEESYNALQEDQNRAKSIYFITSGQPMDRTDTIIDKVKEKSRSLDCKAVMKMMIITDGSLGSEKRKNHRDISDAACSCPHYCTSDVKERYRIVEFDTQLGLDEYSLRKRLGNTFTESQSVNGSDSVQYTLPYSDFMGLGALIDACMRCLDDQNNLLGVVCTSFTTTELLGMNNVQNEDSYIFLLDSYGRTFIHPKLSDPDFTSGQALSLDIKLFETSEEFVDVYASMTSGLNGNKTFLSNSSIPLGGGRAAFKETNNTYVWKRIPNSPFSVAMVITEGYKELTFNISINLNTKKEQYHRLDIHNQTAGLCVVKEKLALANNSVIKLAMDVFEKPYTYYEYETLDSITKLIDFLSMQPNTSPPREIISSDVAYKVRDAVVATSYVEDDVWKKDNSSGDLYTIWRYVGTEEGVMRLFPGTKLDPYYDPRARPWYITAKAFPNLLIFTTSYEDAFTGKIMMSMAKALFKKHDIEKRIAGVGSLDFSMQYLRSLLINLVTDCKAAFRNKCMLIDLFGYLVYHPDISTTVGSYKETHLIEKEPHVAKHMIRAMLMTKKYSVGFFNLDDEKSSGHVKYFYRVKQLTESRSHSDSCLDYTISPIKETNLLVIKIVKNDCPATSCSCPEPPKKICKESTIEDLQICECPCYRYKVCLNDLPDTKRSLTSTPPDKALKKNVTDTKNWLSDDVKATLDDCLDPRCYISSDHIDCDRLGCEWCFKFANGTHLPNDDKFCGYVGKCLAKSTPHPTAVITPVAVTTKQIITIGPTNPPKPGGSQGLKETELIIMIVFIVLGVLLFLAFAILCYIRYRRNKNDSKFGKKNSVVIPNPAPMDNLEPAPGIGVTSEWM